MMKMTRKMAAMVAAMMAVSSIGAISAFAETITGPASSYPEDSDRSGNVSVELQAEVNNTNTIIDNYTPVWSIEVNTTALVWNVEVTTSGTDNLIWDPSSQTYSRQPGQRGKAAQVIGSSDRSISVTNKSNFDISSETSIVFDSGAIDESLVAESQVFSVHDIENLPGRGNNNVGNIGITLTENGLTIFREGFAPDGGNVRVANANIHFNKEGNVYTNNV